VAHIRIVVDFQYISISPLVCCHQFRTNKKDMRGFGIEYSNGIKVRVVGSQYIVICSSGGLVGSPENICGTRELRGVGWFFRKM